VDLTNLKTQGNIQNQSLDLMPYKKEKRSKYLAKQKSKKTIIEPVSDGPTPTEPSLTGMRHATPKIKEKYI
jgi:hypothetical protein